MIGVAKFLTLDRATQKRKLWRLFRSLSLNLRPENTTNTIAAQNDYSQLQALSKTLVAAPQSKNLWAPALLDCLNKFANQTYPSGAADLIPEIENHLRLLSGAEAAEWDLSPESRRLAGTAPGLLVFIEGLRSPFNVGSIFRTAEAFGFSQVILSPDSPGVDNRRLHRSAMGSTDRIIWSRQSFADLTNNLAGTPVFALELGGTSINQFNFPETGIVALGSEELGLRPETLRQCRQSAGIVSIPLLGSKASLNVGVGFGILAQNWLQAIR